MTLLICKDGEKNFVCETCNNFFTTKQCLEYHVNNNVCDKNIKKFKCKYCDHLFKTNNSMCRHVRTSCKEKKKIDNERNDIYERLLNLEKDNNKLKMNNIMLQQKISKIKKQKSIVNDGAATGEHYSTNLVGCTINNTNNNTINNIILVGCGNEDLSKMNQNELFKAIRDGIRKSTIKLTDVIHFNPNYPEYHNVYIGNMKDKYAMLYDGKQWLLKTKNEVVDKLYDDKKIMWKKILIIFVIH